MFETEIRQDVKQCATRVLTDELKNRAYLYLNYQDVLVNRVAEQSTINEQGDEIHMITRGKLGLNIMHNALTNV